MGWRPSTAGRGCRRPRWRHAAAPLAAIVAACSSPAGSSSAPAALTTAPHVAAAESSFANTRDLRDEIDVTRSEAGERTPSGTPLKTLAGQYTTAAAKTDTLLAAIDTMPLSPTDRRAVSTMRATASNEFGALTSGSAAHAAAAPASPCAFDAQAVAADSGGAAALGDRIYACYGSVAHRIPTSEGDLDRLTILGRLASEPDPARRRTLFLALGALWRTVNANDEPTSPYRTLARLTSERWKHRGSPIDSSARALGVNPAQLEDWLTAALSAWRATLPDSSVEPWDWYYDTGRMGRVLDARVPRSKLEGLVADYYAALGADPRALRVREDLAPREGKTPVAFTTFERRPRWMNGAWRPGVAFITATYDVGGIGNLAELLHETGHAVHISAIRTRPAFADWPDSDPFTEGIADVVALEMYEPTWQQRWLGDSVSMADSWSEKYSGIVFDIAWSLFEVRMMRDPSTDPNVLWTEITSDYLHIKPHPELSWWAMRGQLIDAPGYMMNYALGAFIVADIRARARALHGAPTLGDRSWYEWMSRDVYRYGLERTSRDVIESFLGRPLGDDALLADMGRMKKQ